MKRAFGEELYDRDATAYFEEGTRENPVPILSVEDERVVGISLPDDAEIRWFTLRAGELAYDPDTCNYFALKKVRGCGAAQAVRGWSRSFVSDCGSQRMRGVISCVDASAPMQVTQAEVDEWVAKAEKQVLGGASK